MDSSPPAPWIKVGEKYALVGLQLKLEGMRSQQITSRLWALTEAAFEIPKHWQDWLGTVHTQEVNDCSLFLVSKCKSVTPDVLDGENQTLQQRVWNFYVGLLLASTFSPGHDPVRLTGACTADGISIRQHQILDAYSGDCDRLFRPNVTGDSAGSAL